MYSPYSFTSTSFTTVPPPISTYTWETSVYSCNLLKKKHCLWTEIPHYIAFRFTTIIDTLPQIAMNKQLHCIKIQLFQPVALRVGMDSGESYSPTVLIPAFSWGQNIHKTQIQNSCTDSKLNTFQMYIQNITVISRCQKIILINLFHKNWIHEVLEARGIMYSPKYPMRNSFSFTSLNMACHVIIFHKLKCVLHSISLWTEDYEGREKRVPCN